jgi:cysteinyl-tRNA synthetase
MPLFVSNTLSGLKEEFVPLEPGRAGLYTCGPTVYNFIHIGNLRTFLWEDVLRRHLEFSGYAVTHVMNITDVDDKTIRDSAKEGISLRAFTERFTEYFFEDIRTLRVKPAHHYPRATDFIPQMVEIIRKLTERGFTYTSEDGSVYFRIAAFPGYGRLAKLDLEGIKPGARVATDEYEKEDVRDFALWKAEGDGPVAWDTPIGRGRPGWHIECSAMSSHYLGETFDLHTGAVDNIFPHHENEIAQSECASGKPFVKYWLHAEHLIVDGEKMAKSKGNFYTLRDLLEKGHAPLAIRYLLISVPYKKKLNFTFAGLEGAYQAVDRLSNFIARLNGLVESGADGGADILPQIKSFKEGFRAGLDNDLNTAEAIGALFSFIREVNPLLESNSLSALNAGLALQALREADAVLDLFPPAPKLQEEALPLIKEREVMRKAKRWAEADAIRTQLSEMGVILEDTAQGTRWRKKI